MAAELQKGLGIKAELVQGGGGVFDVIIDGKLVFSKYETGRFPTAGEVLNKIKS